MRPGHNARDEAELTIAGLWHIEDIDGRTIADTADLHDAWRYMVREMAVLIGEVLGYCTGPAARCLKEAEMRHGPCHTG
jgi:hypothetical protein